MNYIAKQIYSGMLAMAIAMLFVFSVIQPQVHAADVKGAGSTVQDAVIKLTGRKADGKYELTSKDLYLFSLEGAAPGDTWTGSVKVKNETDSDMAVAVHSITSTLKHGTALFDVLDLSIAVAGRQDYAGAYAADSSPVTDYYKLRSGDEMSFDIAVTFPSTAGNAYQGKQMDSTWIFDAIYYDSQEQGQTPSVSSDPVPPEDSMIFDDIVKTGKALMRSNTSLITSLFLLLASVFAACLTYARYRSVKRRHEEWQGREEPQKTTREDV